MIMKLTVLLFAVACATKLDFQDSDGTKCTIEKFGNEIQVEGGCDFKSNNIENTFDGLALTDATHTQDIADLWQAHNNLAALVDDIDVHNSCHDHAQSGAQASGTYQIEVGIQTLQVYCYFYQRRGVWTGIDMYQVFGGSQTFRSTDINSCPSGMNIWVPRSKAHMDNAVANFPNSAKGLTGIFKPTGGCGGCTSHAMNSDTVQHSHGWTSVAAQPTPWFLRDAAYS